LVELRITDDGPGLPPDMVEAVFDRFVSIDGKGGSGLGLPIARTLARAHGGELSYESKAFVVRIPAHAAAGGDRRLDLSGLNEA
jgi:signal transduction histidine kinase